MFISGQPYTSFKGVNVKDGKVRFQGTTKSGTDDYGVVLKVDQGDITTEKEVYFGNGSGTAMVIGYHVLYGTTSFQANTNIVANGIGQASVAITGIIATSLVLVSAESTAATNVIPIGGAYRTTDSAWIYYHIGAATAATTAVPVSYMVLTPKTA